MKIFVQYNAFFFSSLQMMHILESLLQQENHSYLRMDGTTPMSQRQETIYTFNNVCRIIHSISVFSLSLSLLCSILIII